MADSDKTIDGFAFWIENEENGVCYIPLNLCKKIMKLLKEREPKPPVVKENSYGWKFYYCPSCGKEFYQNNKSNFCEKCGQVMKWK